ncbi:dephospho-CoA kinase [Butyrivibrio sp. JL13D10]|uniref:dephospho-CoA kinase n=1 Tax=Butyrivibrio sp. JL13D10 TaxID=3236815 RepID=UPI0038B4A04A
MTKIIGITGGVGAGKSTVLNYIKSRCNCRVIFSDDVANDIKLRGMPCYEPIVELLSEDILGSDFEIDKKKMGARIFSDEELLRKVNDILHPAVNKFIFGEIDRERKEGKYDYLFVEAALLIENGYDKIVDELWYIYASVDVRRQRLKEQRGYSDEKINDILNGQLSDEEFRKFADFVIDNSGDEKETKRQIDLKLGEN